MKKTILTSLFGLLTITNVLSQEVTKMFTGAYVSSDYLTTEDGDFVQVNFKGNDGKPIDFTEDAGTFMADGPKTKAFIGKTESANNITNKLNIGNVYTLMYKVNGNGVNIITTVYLMKSNGQTKSPQDSVFQVVKKAQDGLLLQNKCPNCALDGAKQFIKTFITKLGTDKESSETKAFLESALTENKFVTYYFSSKRASVIINKKLNNRYYAVQLIKESNKWVGLGIDDSFTSCKGLKPEDKVSQQEIKDCNLYLDKMFKNK